LLLSSLQGRDELIIGEIIPLDAVVLVVAKSKYWLAELGKRSA